MTKGWFAEQLRLASKEAEQWPEWKKEELRAAVNRDRDTQTVGGNAQDDSGELRVSAEKR